MCVCGHEQGFHNPCSRCECPFYLDRQKASAKDVKLWRKTSPVKPVQLPEE